MNDTVIRVENLSKRYRISALQRKHDTLRDVIADWGFRISKFQIRNSKSDESIWALKDVSFEVKKGEVVGIIGRNGAGKTTLLKILSRITEPTEGYAEIHGRVGSLLEVGTGFHPELSGRENIYLNGAILGMKKREIDKKFDEIVSFAEIEKFIDTPVKRYSSGMYVRLAFAVAAHLEPEILLVDEVLAVGDAEFQKKCLGKMKDVSGQGRTVLFVSHNMASIKSLCNKSIMLENGFLAIKGNTQEVIDKYINESIETNAEYYLGKSESTSDYGYVEKISIENEEGIPQKTIPIDKPWQVRVRYRILHNTPHFIIGLGLTSSENYPIRTVWSKPADISPGTYEAIFREDKLFLSTGRYKIIIGLSSREIAFQYIDNLCYMDIENYANKEKYVRTEGVGVILNPMNISINRLY